MTTNASVKFHNWPLWKRVDLQKFLYQRGKMPTKVLWFKPCESIWECNTFLLLLGEPPKKGLVYSPTLNLVFQALQNCKQRGTVWKIRDCCCCLEVTLVCVLFVVLLQQRVQLKPSSAKHCLCYVEAPPWVNQHTSLTEEQILVSTCFEQ